nr:DUF3558 domain-containing protein [Rhodococcus sp. (in: high G+C Gram-positive bacteria)]
MQWRHIAVLGAAIMLAGCGAGAEGTAVADGPAEAFDPCSIPDDAISSTGLDPSTKQVGWIDGIDVPGWVRCAWSGPQGNHWYYFVVLFSDRYDITDVEGNPRHYDFSDVEVGSRDGVLFRYDVTKEKECDTAFQTSSGVATFAVTTMGGLTTETDPCTAVSKHTTDLETYFPQP